MSHAVQNVPAAVSPAVVSLIIEPSSSSERNWHGVHVERRAPAAPSLITAQAIQKGQLPMTLMRPLTMVISISIVNSSQRTSMRMFVSSIVCSCFWFKQRKQYDHKPSLIAICRQNATTYDLDFKRAWWAWRSYRDANASGALISASYSKRAASDEADASLDHVHFDMKWKF